MISKDHEAVGEYLLSKMSLEMSENEKRAFLFGNIEPDLNPFTYLRGSIRNQTFRGHNYENSHAYIRLLIYQVEHRRVNGIMHYYLLGKLMHYIADAFTHPHNRAFKGTLREHCQYERVLHTHMQEALIKERNVEPSYNYKNSLMRQIEQMHADYEKEQAGYQIDCDYIIDAVTLVWEYFAELDTYGLQKLIA